MDSKDTAAFVYGDSLQRDVQNKREVLIGDIHSSYLSDEKENADDNVSKNMVTVDMAEV